MSEQPTSANFPSTISVDVEQLMLLDALLVVIARRAGTRFEGDLVAVEIAELVGKAEALVANLTRGQTR